MDTIESTVDRDDRTLTFVTVFEAPPERVWQVWEDPRQLERWWGPPTWPATFTRHEVEPGGESRYHMTGPDGEKAPGWWRTIAVDAPHRYEFEDGFSTDDGEPDTSMPSMHMVITLEADGPTTRMTVVASYASVDDLDKVLGMGMREGMTGALSQVPALLAA
ncbi:SRPBCC family protein [Frondihabitans australicus]|uniref:Uncharacterized protein YndB with AHSA1/START domain n=1 Tax=Frondihabitans australicus TaxID=386892 RepID=A0A495IKE1_9MICO|nr:SRPBCC domain-containing protein [Frondihabitans australicus]RKR75761.1 uncharacterized protein YndB with AHSA1/START domain [Frondihabitans australicus]